jgi:hypothetical protein
LLALSALLGDFLLQRKDIFPGIAEEGPEEKKKHVGWYRYK